MRSSTLNEIITDEKVRAPLVAAGVIVEGSTAKEFGQLIAQEYKRWNRVREFAGIVPQ
jgi:tripartite-type tricarboxylate transporter receptor subunit TctC